MPRPPTKIATAIAASPGMKASGPTPSAVAARATRSLTAWGTRQRLAPYQMPAMALLSPYSASSGPAIALAPCSCANAMVARWTATNRAPADVHGDQDSQSAAAQDGPAAAPFAAHRGLACPVPGQADHSGQAQRKGDQQSADRPDSCDERYHNHWRGDEDDLVGDPLQGERSIERVTAAQQLTPPGTNHRAKCGHGCPAQGACDDQRPVRRVADSTPGESSRSSSEDAREWP